jgi:SWI/SNF-related matrix-associated actin-dependent regulator 1 of chromatin subfamily A
VKRQRTPDGFFPSSSPHEYLTSPTYPNTNTYVTQPTQLLPVPIAKISEIMVPATSPAKTIPQRPTSRINSHGDLTEEQRTIQNRMAPPGTFMNVPQFPNSQRNPVLVDSDDDNFVYDSEEDISVNRADIPSAKTVSQVRKNSPPPMRRGTSSQSGSFLDKFGLGSKTSGAARSGNSSSSGSFLDKYGYGANSSGPKSAFGSQQQSAEVILDAQQLSAIQSLKSIVPNKTEAEIIAALRKHRWNKDDAMMTLFSNEESMSSKRDFIDLTQPKGVASTAKSPQKRQTFHQQDNKRSIAQKHGILRATQSQSEQPLVPKRRKLMQGRRDRTPEPEPEVIEIVDDTPKPKVRKLVQGRKRPSPEPEIQEIEAFPRPKQKIQLAKDLSDESDATESQEEVEDENDDEELLDFFNTCDAKQLADLATTTEENAAYIISKRPFRNLDRIRAIQSEEEPPKNAKGRAPRRKPIGDKVVDATEKMWRGLKAIDMLVKECNTLNTRVKGGMERLGIRVHNNELDVSKFETDSRADSGLGTPTSVVSSKYLGKPSIMSSDLDLKSHQIVGLNWLNLLHSEGISAILADDMGLGKTCQVIAFLSHLAEKGNMGRHLIIVPGSTLENWLREFERFSPELSVYPYHGSQKERLQMQEDVLNGDYDVVLTTYDMATKKDDNRFFRKLAPKTITFDEGHMLKNKTSNRFQQLIKIPTPWRLLLTGTPLQNNLLELISILHFMMPDMFKDQAGDMDVIFKHKAKTTDEEHSALLSAQRVARARQMMAPFILRRKKEDVDSALPPKTRRIEYCGMTQKQQQVYDEYTAIHQEALMNRKEGITSIPQNYLMDRRKAAIHPLLFRYLYTNEDIEKMHKKVPRDKGVYKGWSALKMKEEMEWWSDFKIHQLCLDIPGLNRYALEEGDWMDSGKIEAVTKLLDQFDKEGSRALLFSQFTMVMDILESVFNSKGIKFCRLDGSTPIAARQDWIDTFHNDESYKVFMLSTRSGGTGINLACANKVIIFDASFNPQDDMQAENRAHRFGQTRDVEVIRLISRNTVEEQIHTLCEGKLALEGAVTGEDGEKKGIEMVQQMLAEREMANIGVKEEKDAKVKPQSDVKDVFLSGLKKAGLNVQA